MARPRRAGFSSFFAALIALVLCFPGWVAAQTVISPTTAQVGGSVYAVVRDAAGRTIVGGSFTWAGSPSTPRANLARFNVDGTVDATWNPGTNGFVHAIALNQSGSVFVGGAFSSAGGQTRNNIAKLSSSGAGAADVTWNPNANNTVRALALDDSGNIYAGGFFTNISGQPRNGIAKLSTSTTGAADATWNAGGGSVLAIVLSDTGHLYAGGGFASIGGQTRSRIGKVSTSTTGPADPTWNPGVDGPVEALALDSSGNLFIGGVFDFVSGQVRGRIAKVSTSGAGTLDAVWNPGTIGNINSLILDGSGNLYVGGNFNNIGGQARNNVAKLSSSGTGAADATWNPNPSSTVFPIVLDGGGNVCMGGSFTSIAGQARSGYACVSPNVPNVAPSFTSSAATTFTIGSASSFTVTVSGSPTPTLALTSGALPPGVTFNPSTGVISGTPTAVGTYTPTFTATNSQGTANQNFTLTVVATVPGKAAITNVTPGNNQLTVAFSPPPSDGGSPILDYTVQCSAGASTQSNTGTTSPITVTGLTNNTSYTCTVRARNGIGDGTPSDPAGATPTSAPVNVGALAFGGQSMGTTSRPKEFAFGFDIPVTVTSITLTAQFGQSSNCGTIPGGSKCTVQVTFSPTTVSGGLNSSLPVTGLLTIVTANAGSFTVTLSGTAEKSLVTHYYSAILLRDPDPGGKAFWTAEAGRVAALGVNPNEVWFAMAQAFYSSGEYQARNRSNTGFVTDMYTTFFNRAPDSGGLDFWLANLGGGMPREVVLASFMFSSEFTKFTQDIFGNTAARAEVDTVVDFYRGLLARLPDDGGFNFWVGKFRTAQCQGQAAIINEVEAISSQFALAGEYLARNRTDAQYVGDLYNAFLRRGGDLGGVQFWINQIAGGFRTRENVRVEFKKSAEFQARVQAIIAQGCLS